MNFCVSSLQANMLSIKQRYVKHKTIGHTLEYIHGAKSLWANLQTLFDP